MTKLIINIHDFKERTDAYLAHYQKYRASLFIFYVYLRIITLSKHRPNMRSETPNKAETKFVVSMQRYHTPREHIYPFYLNRNQ